MKYARILAASLLAVALLAVGSISTANAQGTLAAPTNVTAINGSTPGHVVVSWTAVPDAQYYRIGWVAWDDYLAVDGAGRDWLEAFVFVDVENRGQSSRTVTRLTPGTLYLFIVASNDSQYGSPNWSVWSQALTTTAGTPACPAGPEPQPITPTGSVATDRAALIAFYNEMDGPNWLNRTNWLTSAPLQQWHGVRTDENGRVTELLLSMNRLSGELPVGLINLPMLEELWLSDNQISGQIPAELGNLSNLRTLTIRNTQLSGEIPATLGNLSRLDFLALSGNRLQGGIPASLSNLSNLTRLELHGNLLFGEIPAFLGNLSNLQYLELSHNAFSGSIPASLGNLSNLETLTLSHNRLSGQIPASLGNLHNLMTLTLIINDFTGCIPAGLSDVPDNDFSSLNLPFCGN